MATGLIRVMQVSARLRIAAMLITAFACGFAQQPEPDLGSAIEAHKQAAQQALARHDLKAVAGEYDAILKLNPNEASILSAKGILLYASGRASEAETPLRQALANRPDEPQTETFLGLSLADSGKCREAEPILERRFVESLEAKTRRLAGLALLACAGVQQPDVAVETAQKLQRWYPDDADVLYQTAELYSELSRRAVNDLLKKHPDSFRIHELAGEAWEAKGNDEQALSEYRRALEFNARAPRLHYRIGQILLRRKTEEGDAAALRDFQQELAINSGDAAAEYQVGELLSKKNDYPSASTHLSRAIELNPEMTEARVGLAKLLSAENNSTAAILQLETAVRLTPDDTAAHYALMQAYKTVGRADDARREIAKVQELHDKEQRESDNLLRTLLTGPTQQKDQKEK